LSVASHYEKTKYKLSTISDLLKYIWFNRGLMLKIEKNS
jgi:hypothetical protein